MSLSTSIYIPRMNMEHTEESITFIMYYNRIGTVSRIDFIPANKKIGFREEDPDINFHKSAFVYFSDPAICCDGLYRYEDQCFIGMQKFWDNIAASQSYKLRVSSHEYWLCLKNKNPIQRTLMNIHQVAENGRYLEGLIEEQAKTIDEQGNKIKELERKLQDIHNYLVSRQGDEC